ncbi:MAG: tRNA dihydrouridine synthase DusB [Gammaproteobacteria bacterium]|nr:tRNA dihydrouridine synthase DusB [Gammaproteobacteria bacterium]
MHIGPVELANPLVLAPMTGVSDFPFRSLCRTLGAAMTVSEMLTSDIKLWSTRKSQLRMLQNQDKAPHAIQIAGTDPAQMSEAARLCVDQGAQIIDINMGCPAKKVCNVSAGSALLQDVHLVTQILQAVVGSVPVPVTLKIRTGWDRQNINALKIAYIAEHSGIQALTIHGRTRADRFQGSAEYETIRQVKSKISIPVIANGDIDSPAKAKSVLDYTHADGLLIGRASQGNPWIFREIKHYLTTGEYLSPPTIEEKCETILQLLRAIHNFYGDYLGVRVARKHLSWFFKYDHPALWRTICQLEFAGQQYNAIEKFLYELQNNRGITKCISNQNRLAA